MNKTNCYLDIHAHILPGVDDGSSDMEETIQMLKQAKEQGIGTIIATPHYSSRSENTSVEQLRAVRNMVQEKADQLELGIDIRLGNELYYTESIVDMLKTGEALTLADSRYVLVEFSTPQDYTYIFRAMNQLVQAGYAPILAHVERYRCLYKREDLVSELVKLGCYIQMNSSSLIGGIFNTEAALNRKLLNLGLVHFIGSDCHDARIRVPNMKDVIKTLQKKCDTQIVDAILEHPLKIIENTYI